MFVRYGPGVLSETEYRWLLRERLAHYVWDQIKQRLRPSRKHDRKFHEFHRKTVDLLVAEADGDRDVRLAGAVVRRLLRSNGESASGLTGTRPR
jgi:hypothetical protein